MQDIDITPSAAFMNAAHQAIAQSVASYNADIAEIRDILDESQSLRWLMSAHFTERQMQLVEQALGALQEGFEQSRDAQQEYLDAKAIQEWRIAFFEIDRAYGGPEEGGWWYDTGVRVRILRNVFVGTKEQAYARCRHVNHLMHFIQRGLRDVGSVIYDGGRYSAQLFNVDDEIPARYPEVRPHYE